MESKYESEEVLGEEDKLDLEIDALRRDKLEQKKQKQRQDEVKR
jgi:hypothetical protein